MRRKPLFWHLFPSYLALSLVPIAVFGWVGFSVLHHSYFSEAVTDLTSKARLVERLLEISLDAGRAPAVQRSCRSLASAAEARITVVLPSGQVLADSVTLPEQMENHAGRPEIMQALAGGIGTAVRHSSTLRHDMLYLAVPHIRSGTPAAVIRLAVPTTSLRLALVRFYRRLAIAGLLLFAATAVLALIISRRISRPWTEIQAGAERFARGDFSRKLPPATLKEADGLAACLNQMAGQLDERLRTVLRQQDQLQAVLASMAEGVLAFDREERLLSINAAAARLFGLDVRKVQGRILSEVIRNSRLRQMASEILTGPEPPIVEGELSLCGGIDCDLRAHGAALRNPEGQRIGGVIVFHDVTRLHRLENLRREFVANVSHELKTPITLLQGFIETLQEGALKKPDDAKRFLQIMAKQAARLNAIIEDLLSLSRIEQDAERGQIALEEGPVRDVLYSALSSCRPAADARRITLEPDCPDDLRARMNARLLEQAVINLVDNAIKYGDADTRVRIEARVDGPDIALSVRDQGPGIEAEHLPRLFERFYRVDKGRSRDAGGSGLGLAIVKHIVLAHGGRATIESRPGTGSTFTLHWPR